MSKKKDRKKFKGDDKAKFSPWQTLENFILNVPHNGMASTAHVSIVDALNEGFKKEWEDRIVNFIIDGYEAKGVKKLVQYMSEGRWGINVLIYLIENRQTLRKVLMEHYASPQPVIPGVDAAELLADRGIGLRGRQ